MSLSDEMQDERTKVVASTRDLQAGVIKTWMTDGSGAPLPSNEEVRPSTDRGVAEQSLLVRHHLPSKAESDHSNKLIDGWKSEIAAINQDISNEQEGFRQERQKLDRLGREKESESRKQYQASIDAIRKETERETNVIEEQSRQRIDLLKVNRHVIEERMNIEQAFLAQIRKIPVEALAEIFRWHVGDGVPSRKLALVCKSWRALILETPCLWWAHTAYPVYNKDKEWAVKRCKRRIELSRSTFLNVSLNINEYAPNDNDNILFQLIAETGTERWQHLKLSVFNGSQIPENYLGNMFRGNFRALQTIWIDCCSSHYNAIFDSLYRHISISKPPIKAFNTSARTTLPDPFQNAEIFQHVTQLSTSGKSISNMLPLPSLHSLCVTGMHSTLNATRFPPLPKDTEIESLTRFQLSYLQLQHVQTLKIVEWVEVDNESTIEMPNLLVLSVSSRNLSIIKRVSAPRLQSLRIGTLGNHSTSLSGDSATSIFGDAIHLVLMKPVSLEIYALLTGAEWILIWKAWPQLLHVTLRLGGLAWKSIFSSGLTKRAKPLCPSLISLRMQLSETRANKAADDLKQCIEKLKELRKDMPFKDVAWSRASPYAYGGWNSIESLDSYAWSR